MKKYFRPSFWLSLFMTLLVIGVSSLGVFLAQEKMLTSGETSINQKNYKQYFKEKKINNQISSYFNLKLNDQRDRILWSLTNWNENNDSLLSFTKSKVSSNILNFVDYSINCFTQFSKEKLYINIKYELINTQSLIIDIRWANLNAVKNKQNTNLFWEMTKINLS